MVKLSDSRLLKVATPTLTDLPALAMNTQMHPSKQTES
jgi:hypothetical protein